MTSQNPHRPKSERIATSLWQWFLYHCRFGSLSFGGSGRMLVYRDALVEEHRWISAEDYHRAFTFSSVFPGPNLVNVVAYSGFTLFGWKGAVAGILGMSIPGAFVALFIVATLPLENRHVRYVFEGFSLGSILMYSLFIWKLVVGLGDHMEKGDVAKLKSAKLSDRTRVLARSIIVLGVGAASFGHLPLSLILIFGIGLGLLLEFVL